MGARRPTADSRAARKRSSCGRAQDLILAGRARGGDLRPQGRDLLLMAPLLFGEAVGIGAAATEAYGEAPPVVADLHAGKTQRRPQGHDEAGGGGESDREARTGGGARAAPGRRQAPLGEISAEPAQLRHLVAARTTAGLMRFEAAGGGLLALALEDVHPVVAP